MLNIQKDVYSAYDKYLANSVIAAASHYPPSELVVKDAVTVLRSWNGQMEKSDAAPVLTQLLSTTLGKRLVGTSTELLPRPEAIESVLRERPHGWVKGDDWDRWILEAFKSAVEEGRSQQGSPVSGWRWGRLLHWTFQHPLGKQLPLVSGYFDIGPVEMSGSATTVKQTLPGLGPSQRMVVDLADFDKSVQNLATGESGFVASGHYKDQWPAYYVGKSFPMEFQYVDAKDTLTIVPSANPK
jgi:penicillin amidase